MMPNSGINLLKNLIIILGFKIFRFLRHRLIPTVIIFIIIVLMFIGATRPIIGAWLEGNNIEFFQDWTYRCEKFPEQSKPNKVIIRMDDVQAFWLTDIQKKIMLNLEERGIPASISVIPYGLLDDKKMSKFLSQHDCHFEYTLHGYDQGKDIGYQAPEFALLDQQKAGERIDKGLEILKQITKDPVITFVPPNNSYSIGTREALLKRGFKVVSAERGGYFDYNAATYNYPDNYRFTTEESFNQCKSGLEKTGLCVLMIHPQDFATDEKLDNAKYDDFMNLLDRLQNMDVEFTTFECQKDRFDTIPFPYDERDNVIKKVSQDNSENAPLEGYKYVKTTKFWVGEKADSENGFIPNDQSAWDKNWLNNFGGVDDPDNRCGLSPCGFQPKQNPFYFALPYNDLNDNGSRKESSKSIPWAKNVNTRGSIVKNRWIEVKYKDKTCYAQWEDVGPFNKDDFDYVFGSGKPKNKFGVGAGLDISPSVWDCLGLPGNSMVNWKFVSDEQVPDGPWSQTITKTTGYIID